jgi:uncharacterized protein YjdB
MTHPVSPIAQLRTGWRIAFAFLAITVACGPESRLTDTVATVTITPPNAMLVVGDTIRLKAAADGLTPCVCRWSTSEPGVASVASPGLVRGLTAGQAIVTATLTRDSTARVSALIVVVVR